MAEELPVCNVAILHDKFRNKPEDRYIADIALALSEQSVNIAIYTTDFCKEKSILPLEKYVHTFGFWIPSSICGVFKHLFSLLRSTWLSLQLAMNPPTPRPSTVILDVEPIALFLLSLLTNYKTFYIYHFPHLRSSDHYDQSMFVIPQLLTQKTIRFADEIIVQTKCLQEIFKRSFSEVKEPLVLTPCYSTGLWSGETIDVRHIISDLPTNYKIFVAFGEFKERSNFVLVLEALEHLLTSSDNTFKEELHVVIAGSCKDNCMDYYNKLIELTNGKPFASQVSFLNRLPTVHKKTLMQAATAVIHLVNNDVYPGPIIAAMSMGKAIITVDCGFASTVLTHRISGIFVEPDPLKLSTVMKKIADSDMLQTFLGNMARSKYLTDYSYKCFSDQIFNWCTQPVPVRYASTIKAD